MIKYFLNLLIVISLAITISSCLNKNNLKLSNPKKIALEIENDNQNFINKNINGYSFSYKSWNNQQNQIIKSYSFTRRIFGYKDTIPIVSFFYPKKYDNYEILITYDDNKKMKEIKQFHEIITLKPAIFCFEKEYCPKDFPASF